MIQNGKENCHHDHITFNVKGNGNKVFSVYVSVVAERNVFFLCKHMHNTVFLLLLLRSDQDQITKNTGLQGSRLR